MLSNIIAISSSKKRGGEGRTSRGQVKEKEFVVLNCT